MWADCLTLNTHTAIKQVPGCPLWTKKWVKFSWNGFIFRERILNDLFAVRNPILYSTSAVRLFLCHRVSHCANIIPPIRVRSKFCLFRIMTSALRQLKNIPCLLTLKIKKWIVISSKNKLEMPLHLLGV